MIVCFDVLFFVTISVLGFYTETSSIKSLHMTQVLSRKLLKYIRDFIQYKKGIYNKRKEFQQKYGIYLYFVLVLQIVFIDFQAILSHLLLKRSVSSVMIIPVTCYLLYGPGSLSLQIITFVELKCLLWITITTNFHKITLILYSYDILLSKMTKVMSEL